MFFVSRIEHSRRIGKTRKFFFLILDFDSIKPPGETLRFHLHRNQIQEHSSKVWVRLLNSDPSLCGGLVSQRGRGKSWDAGCTPVWSPESYFTCIIIGKREDNRNPTQILRNLNSERPLTFSWYVSRKPTKDKVEDVFTWQV